MNTPRVVLGALTLTVTLTLAQTAAAQKPESLVAATPGQTFHACFVPEVGAVYLIGLPGLPAACLSSAHQPISWTDGVADGAIATAKLADQAVVTTKLADLAVTTVKLADQAVTADKLAVSLPSGEPGLSCWDRNGNGEPDPAEDINGDGLVDVTDCRGESGDAGLDGRHCWDTDENGVADPAEDTNGDAVIDVRDCVASGADHGVLDGLVDDDHTQYLLTDGVRSSSWGFAVTRADATAPDPPVTGAGSRFMWYPRKRAFRAGHVTGTQWDEVNVGEYSIALGHDVTASGNNATAIGAEATASGDNAFAQGLWSVASGENATAIGYYAKASGDNSVALGSNANTSDKTGAFVYADASVGGVSAPADNSFTVRAAGGTLFDTPSFVVNGILESTSGGVTFPDGTVQTTAGGAGATAHGALTGLAEDDHAQYLLADGVRSSVNGFAVTASGSGTIPESGAGTRLMWYPGKAAFRAGLVNGNQWDDASVGTGSVAFGGNTTANGLGAAALGWLTMADADGAAAMGLRTVASGRAALAVGEATEASGEASTALGFNTTAQAFASVALGQFNVDWGSGSSWVPTDPLLVVGNGTNAATPNNALVLLKNGDLKMAGEITAARIRTRGVGPFSTGLGEETLGNNTGEWNTASGYEALKLNTTGIHNTASGAQALDENTTGSSNTAVGSGALGKNNASNNTAIGYVALFVNTSGGGNTASGSHALRWNQTGSSNTASGLNALYTNKAGDRNTASGYRALYENDGSFNTATGSEALVGNRTGNRNTGSGYQALHTNWLGDENTAIGYQALYNATGSGNTAVGSGAGSALTTGSDNIIIGNSSGSASDDKTIRIGSSVHTSTYIGGIRNVDVGSSGASVFVSSNGQLGTLASSRRYKEDIADIGELSARVLALRPVAFRYRKPADDGTTPRQFGLIAEEVAEVFPELAVYNERGEPESVKYHLLSSLLLNELKRQQRELTVLHAENRLLHDVIADLAAAVRRVEGGMATIRQQE